MSDADHLNEVMTAFDSKLGQTLFKSYRDMVRNPDVAPKDYGIRLKEIIEEEITKRPEDAPPGIIDN